MTGGRTRYQARDSRVLAYGRLYCTCAGFPDEAFTLAKKIATFLNTQGRSRAVQKSRRRSPKKPTV